MNNAITFLEDRADVAAPLLLGCLLEREIDGQQVRVRIVETEAYDQTDEASHSFRGQTPRTAPMFGPAGYAYVYFTYGMHHCMNIVVGPKGHGSAVLIRAVEPLEKYSVITERRPKVTWNNTTNGPGKLCQALSITRELSGHDMSQAPLRLIVKEPVDPADVITATRIGISQATDKLWRYYLKDNSWVSKQC